MGAFDTHPFKAPITVLSAAQPSYIATGRPQPVTFTIVA